MAIAAIQVISRDNTHVDFTADERKALTEEFGPSWSVVWLPPNQTNLNPDGDNHHLITTILILVAGLTVSSALKSFFDGFFKEAGKDGWQGLKTLLAKLWKTQSDKAYTLDTGFASKVQKCSWTGSVPSAVAGGSKPSNPKIQVNIAR
jgi:hypothetical protein